MQSSNAEKSVLLNVYKVYAKIEIRNSTLLPVKNELD